MSEGRVAKAFDGVDAERSREKEDAHDGKQSPALALVSDHASESVGQRRSD